MSKVSPSRSKVLFNRETHYDPMVHRRLGRQERGVIEHAPQGGGGPKSKYRKYPKYIIETFGEYDTPWADEDRNFEEYANWLQDMEEKNPGYEYESAMPYLVDQFVKEVHALFVYKGSGTS